MRIQIVNENDKLIGHKERSQVHETEDIYRASCLWIENSIGEILVAQRALTKSNDPGLWSIAVSGTIDEGETYESNVVKEAEEELGITDIKPTFVTKFFQPVPRKMFAAVFSLVYDAPLEDFVPQQDEVAQIAWVTKQDLLGSFTENPEQYVPSMPVFIDMFVRDSASNV